MISFKYICYTRQLISCDWGFSLWVCMQNIPKKRSTSPPQRSWPSLLLGWYSSLELFSSRRHFSCPDSPPLPSLLLQGLPSASRVPTSAGATRRSSHGVSTRSSCPSSTTVPPSCSNPKACAFRLLLKFGTRIDCRRSLMANKIYVRQ